MRFTPPSETTDVHDQLAVRHRKAFLVLRQISSLIACHQASARDDLFKADSGIHGPVGILFDIDLDQFPVLSKRKLVGQHIIHPYFL